MLQRILNYEILRKIGDGGMGEVYLAKNIAMEQYVAIKMLHPKYASNTALRDRFRKEAMMLSSLNHPNIVSFLNFVENEDGVFLIMEYVDGVSLEEFIHKKNGLIVESKAYPMVCQLLDAFTYAHSKGIVHRDIKPGNILIDKSGQIKILDFGIAQIMKDSGASSSDITSKSGSTAYMSPEQVLDRPLEQTTDVYSLGVVIYEMLTGMAPYDTTQLKPIDIKNKIVNEPLPRIRDRYEFVNEGWQQLVDAMTRKDPKKRIRSCVGARRYLDRALKPKRGNKWLIWVLVILAIILIGGAGGYYGYKFFSKSQSGPKYYAGIEEHNGIVSGVEELEIADLSGHEMVYKLVSRDGQVVRQERMDSERDLLLPASPKDSLDNYAIAEYTYSETGELKSVKLYNTDEELLYTLDYGTDGNFEISEITEAVKTTPYAGKLPPASSSKKSSAGKTKSSHKHRSHSSSSDSTGRRNRPLVAPSKGAA